MRAHEVATRLKAWFSGRIAFSVTFFAFVVAALSSGWRSPLGPGQDQHYHLMNAWITARWWLGDTRIRELYKVIDPLTPNTFVYTFLFPFEVALRPLDAWRVGFTLLYFVGYPVACACALALLRRPLWGALLAFPLAYIKSWSQGGFIPFTSAGPLFVLTIAVMHRALEDASAPAGPAGDATSPRRWRMVVAAVVLPVVTFCAHFHVYGWLMALLGLLTLVFAGRLLLGVPRRGLRAVAATALLGLRALLIVLPSLLLCGLWWWRTHRDPVPGSAQPLVPQEGTWNSKLITFVASFVHVKDDVDWGWPAALLCVVFFVIVLSGRPSRREVPSFEIVAVVSLASYFLAPGAIGGQSFGVRHVDFFVWLLPLVVYPATPKGRLRAFAAVTLITGYAALRLDYLAKNLRLLQREYAGLTQLAKPCPSATGELAYVTFGMFTNTWEGGGHHQAHETYAAICGIDTPVYDPTRYPYNLISVRYRGAPPAPVTILVDSYRWWLHPNLWKDFEVVLVRNWKPSATELEEASKVATRIRVWNEWQLWHRKPDLSQVP